ncbi:hypothetical protein, conserved [Leishmania lindenbergi]|uniref:Uncharacterized protein n=1 Tax=Leishmania lindenbergi TaxID=651832 RepID=A0AAW3AY18_9TRYP
MRIFTAVATFAALRSSGAAATIDSPLLSPLLHQRRTVRQSSTPPGPPPSPSPPSSTVDSHSPVACASSASGRSAAKEAPPSLEPVLLELRTLITHSIPIGKVFRALSPASQKILAAHRLPLEELLLHLPNHFVVHRVGISSKMSYITPHVSPSQHKDSKLQIMRLPPGTKPLPALEQWLGPQKANQVATPQRSTAGGPPPTGTGNDFVDATATLKERLEEVLTYIPNEWVAFAALEMPREVKMRCMGYPYVRPSAFLLKYPQFFEVRVQDRSGNSFLVRRALSLQQQLSRTRKP